MGLLILLAWATVPPSSAPEGVQGNPVDKALSLVAPSKPASRAGDPNSHRIASGGH